MTRHGTPYTEHDRATITRMWHDGASDREIGEALGRTKQGISAIRGKLGLISQAERAGRFSPVLPDLQPIDWDSAVPVTEAEMAAYARKNKIEPATPNAVNEYRARWGVPPMRIARVWG